MISLLRDRGGIAVRSLLGDGGQTKSHGSGADDGVSLKLALR